MSEPVTTQELDLTKTTTDDSQQTATSDNSGNNAPASGDGGDTGANNEGGEKAAEPVVKFSELSEALGVAIDTPIEVKKPEEKQESVKPAQKFPAGARDYSGIPEEHHKLFKGMGNVEFDFAKKNYLENLELKKKVQEVEVTKGQPQKEIIYDHPEAYVLSKEYKEQSTRTNLASQIKTHYMRELAKAQQGLKWRDCDIDPKTGQLIYGEERVATPEDIASLTSFVQDATQQAYNEQQKLQQVKQSFGNQYQQSVATVEDAIQKYYKPLLDPKHPTAPLQQQAMELVPEQFRGHPMTKLFVLTLAENARLNGLNKKYESEKKLQEANKADAAKAQPTKTQLGSGGGQNGQATVKLSDFAKYDKLGLVNT